MMTKEELEMRNHFSNTAFWIAAATRNVNMTMIMMEKNHRLHYIRGNQHKVDTVLLNNTTILLRTPITSLAQKTAGNMKGLRIYNMTCSPYYRGPSTLSKKLKPSLITSHHA